MAGHRSPDHPHRPHLSWSRLAGFIRHAAWALAVALLALLVGLAFGSVVAGMYLAVVATAVYLAVIGLNM